MKPEQVTASPNPEFSAGAFNILYLSDSPEGFSFETKNAIGRTEAIEGGLKLDKEQKATLEVAIKSEMKFSKTKEVADARQAWHDAEEANLDQAETERLKENFEAVRERHRQKGKKIGLQAIELSGNELSADVQVVPFPVYNTFSNPKSSPELIEFSSATGVAMVLKTSDDRLVIQHRAIEKQSIIKPEKSRGNASYMDIPGASVAGMLDATLMGEGRRPGTPDKVDTDFIKGNILKEAGEELGLAPDNLDKVRIVGLAQDKIKPHNEFLFLADSHLSSDELRETSRLSNRNKNLGDADFEEKFLDIEASPQAIETLLTEVKCPLPPTHAAAMVAAGYSLVVQESGSDAAHQWRSRMEGQVKENYELMDHIVSNHYEQHPEVLRQVPERFWSKRVPERNPDGYSPAYSPEEQGLPSLDDELVRVGLTPETRQFVPEAYLFDVDGVLSDPQEKRVTDEAMFTELEKILEANKPLCFNTGRSIDWMMDRLIQPLVKNVKDKSLLQNLVAIGEKGGTWLTFDKDGNMHRGASQVLSVDSELKNRVSELVDKEYSDAMFLDETKETMLSIEMNDGHDIGDFTKRRDEIAKDLKVILEQTENDDVYKIDPTTIAIDVESPHVGKALGADRFLDYLKARGIVAEEFVTFGDSPSDLDMADELSRRQKPVEFVYVGNNASSLSARTDFPVHNVGGFSDGTLKYLQSRI